MDIATTTRISLPVLVGLFIVGALVFPLVRLRHRSGVWGVVLRTKAHSVERLVSVWMVLLLAALLGWVVIYAAAGTAALGIWPVPSGLALAGISLTALSLGLVVVAQAHMGASWRIGIERNQATALVRSGVFRHVRNPIYTGIVGMVLGLVLTTPSPWSIAAVLLAVLLVSIQARLEETHLAHQHGDAFRDYASTTGRFVPRVGKLRPNA